MARSPGWNVAADRMEVIARPFSSSVWKKTSFLAGTVKYALPSSSTGTVPRTERARLIARLITELVEQEDVTPASPIADLWKHFDADRGGWLGERTASEELTESRR